MEDENSNLRNVIADLRLDKAMLQGVIPSQTLTAVRKRKLVDQVRGEWAASIRRA